jgi:hypothetical protein
LGLVKETKGPENQHPEAVLRASLADSFIASPELILSSHKRVRIVQLCAGYPPIGSVDIEAADINARSWTKMSALRNIVEETQLLIEEFKSSFHDIPGGRGSFVKVEPSSDGNLNYA